VVARTTEPFFTTKDAGTGLGLSQVARSVARVNGATLHRKQRRHRHEDPAFPAVAPEMKTAPMGYGL
jgi:nitrogen fixation/metabolism regulation signal transduction histidine kinase